MSAADLSAAKRRMSALLSTAITRRLCWSASWFPVCWTAKSGCTFPPPPPTAVTIPPRLKPLTRRPAKGKSMGTQPGRILYLQPFIGSALMNLPSEVLGVSAGLDIEKRRHILWKIMCPLSSRQTKKQKRIYKMNRFFHLPLLRSRGRFSSCGGGEVIFTWCHTIKTLLVTASVIKVYVIFNIGNKRFAARKLFQIVHFGF